MPGMATRRSNSNSDSIASVESAEAPKAEAVAKAEAPEAVRNLTRERLAQDPEIGKELAAKMVQ